MKRDSDSLMRLIAFALLLNAALLGVRCSSSSDLSVLEADSPELLARVDELEDAKARDSELLVALQGQIDSLRSDVDALVAVQGINADAIEDLAANPAGGLSDEQSEMLGHMSIQQVPVDDDGNTAKTIRFSGVNVQVVNGMGSTREVNGLGNLIVGYQEIRNPPEAVWSAETDRSGSHNLVVGYGNNYSIYAGQVVGDGNTISGHFSTVSGGENNIADGFHATVAGGLNNIASGDWSTVSGGEQNRADGVGGVVEGFYDNYLTGTQGFNPGVTEKYL